jgi:hypothetical protein
MTKLAWWSWAIFIPALSSTLLAYRAAAAVPENIESASTAVSVAASVTESDASAAIPALDQSASTASAANIAQAVPTASTSESPILTAVASPTDSVSPLDQSVAASPVPINLVLVSSMEQQPMSQLPSVSQLAPAQSAASSTAQAATNQLIPNQQAMSQLTSITQLSDVKPTDWAYQALQSLVERYGCIVGYPDHTYRGQRALTRFEFAAGLNACLDRISELIASSTANLATKEDLATLQRLQEEFAAELAALRGRVDTLEARTAALEANQFSTTTKLSGETLFFVSTIFNQDDEFKNETVFQNRSRLIFDTSFTGTDQLRARLQAGTLEPFNQVGNELGFGAFGNTGDQFVLDLLSYQFAVGDFARINLFANAAGLDDSTFGNTINPLDNPARSAITRFGQRNAIYRTANTSAGAAANFFLTDNISVQLAYLAGEASNPSAGAGLFNGNYGALGQLTFRNLFNRLDLAFTYINAYTGTAPGAEGTITAGVPFGVGSRASKVDVDLPVIANSYGLEANFRILPGLQLGGWVGFSAIRAIGLGDADVWNYAGTLALPDLFKKGSLGGLIFGMQPRLTGSDASIGARLGERKDPDVGFHVEAFYRYALSDNIDITPGFIWITAPNHNEDNPPEFMGVLRTTFRF